MLIAPQQGFLCAFESRMSEASGWQKILRTLLENCRNSLLVQVDLLIRSNSPHGFLRLIQIGMMKNRATMQRPAAIVQAG